MTCHYLCPYGPRTLEHWACQSCDNAIDNLDSTRMIRAMLMSMGYDLYDDEDEDQSDLDDFDLEDDEC